jgi:hypothetical protein
MENLKNVVTLRYSRFLEDPPENRQVDGNPDIVYTSWDFETWTGEDSWKLGLSGWAQTGNAEDRFAGITHWPQDRDRRSRHLALNELYTIIYRDDYDLTLGRKLFNNGLSALYSPANRFAQADFNDPLYPKQFGIWQARLDYYWKDTTFTGAWLPVYQASKDPSPNSRWEVTSNRGRRDFDFPKLLIPLQQELTRVYPDVEGSNFGYFLRGKTTYRGWDAFVSYFHGPNPFWVLKQRLEGFTIVYTKKVVTVDNYAAGFSTAWNKWEFHGEALLSIADDGRDDDYLSYVGGFSYTLDDLVRPLGLEQVIVTLEYARETTLEEQDEAGYVQSSASSRVGHDDVIARVSMKYDEDLSFTFHTHLETGGEGGQLYRGKVSYEFRPGLEFSLAGEMFMGDSVSYYGRWDDNDRIVSMLEYTF